MMTSFISFSLSNQFVLNEQCRLGQAISFFPVRSGSEQPC